MQIIAKIRKILKTTPPMGVLNQKEGGVFGGTILESLEEESLEEESLEEESLKEDSGTTPEWEYALWLKWGAPVGVYSMT